MGEPRYPGRFALGEARETFEQTRRPERLGTTPRVATLATTLDRAAMHGYSNLRLDHTAEPGRIVDLRIIDPSYGI